MGWCLIKDGCDLTLLACFQLCFGTVWLFLTDYVTYCVLKYSLLRKFMHVSFKLLCPKSITFFKGTVFSDLGGGGHVWAAFFIMSC